MDFLKNIDWFNNDGVNLPMLNDFLRNQFYDSIIRNNVKGHDCIDVGFGTGLLSMMALQHGAKSIVAFESDTNRFQLGSYIIKKLNLENKIQLINERFNHSKLDQYPTVDIIFHEVVDWNGWGEGLFHILPRTPRVKSIPNNFEFDVVAAPVSGQFLTALLTPATPGFNPGVEIDESFIKLINELGFPEYQLPSFTLPESGLLEFDFERETIYGWQLALKFARHVNTTVAGYKIDNWKKTNEIFDKHGIRSIPIDFDATVQELVIDTANWREQTILLVPRFKMANGDTKMILDDACHWGFMRSPILLVNPTSDLLVTHNLHHGELTYKLI